MRKKCAVLACLTSRKSEKNIRRYPLPKYQSIISFVSLASKHSMQRSANLCGFICTQISYLKILALSQGRMTTLNK